MKKYYKTILMMSMAVALFLLLPTPSKAMAKTITAVNANVSSNKITVSGTAEAGTVACAVLVYDQSGTTLQAMETCEVAGDNTYSYTLTQEFAAGSYLIKVADYEGGDYASTTAVIGESTEPEGGSSVSLPDHSGDAVDTSSNAVDTSSNTSDDSDDTSSEEPAKEEKVSVAVEYTVVKGDTLSKIARKNNLSLAALLSWNPQIGNPNKIYPGQKIIVGYTSRTVTTQASGTTQASANAKYDVVRKGDFLYRIARRNGLSLSQLATLNPEVMKQKYIYPGQKIRVK